MKVGLSMLAVVGAAGALLSAGPALACSMVPSLPGETSEARSVRLEVEAQAYERDRQKDLWRSADRVFTARVDRPAPPAAAAYDPRRDGPPEPPKPVKFDSTYWETTFALTPVAGLKGAVGSRSFEVVQSSSMTSCGFMHRFDDSAGSFNQQMLVEGEIIVVFITGPYPSQAGLLGTLKAEQAVDPALTAALAKAAR